MKKWSRPWWNSPQCWEVNLKLNKDKCHFRCTSIPFFGKVVSREGIQPDPQKIKALNDMLAPKNKKELQTFLGIINYLGKFSPGTAVVCDPLWKLTSSKVTWTWNVLYQQLFTKAKLLIKTDICMKFYNDTKPLYLEIDASRVGLGATLLQLHDNAMCQKGMVPDNTILHPIAFASKSITGAESRYSNIKREALGILHVLEKFHHYCFGREVIVITNHKPLVAIFKKHVVILSLCIQCILLKIHQYRVQIIYKAGSEIFIADWLSQHNHAEGKDKPIKDMDIRIDTIQKVTTIPECVSISQIQQATAQDNHFQCLKSFIIAGWPSTKDELHGDLRPYWSYRDKLAVIDGVVMEGRYILIPTNLQQQVLDQLHTNHMGIEKTKLLAHKSVYWADIYTYIEKHEKLCNMSWISADAAQGKIIHHNIPLRLWKVLDTDVFHFNNRNYLCIVDYHSKFPVVKRLEGLSTENLITTVKVIFVEYGIPHKIMSDTGTNSASDRFRNFAAG